MPSTRRPAFLLAAAAGLAVAVAGVGVGLAVTAMDGPRQAALGAIPFPSGFPDPLPSGFPTGFVTAAVPTGFPSVFPTAPPSSTSPTPRPPVQHLAGGGFALGGYDLRPCPTRSPAAGLSAFRTQSLAGRKGANGYGGTSLVDAGPLDVSDGLLWQDGAEYDVGGPVPARSTHVPPGQPHVILLMADYAHESGGDVGAIEVRIGTGTPVTWRERDSLFGITDGGSLALAGGKAMERLAAVRSEDDAMDDIGKIEYSSCQRIARTSRQASDIVEVDLGGDGSWVGAIGYDAANNPVDIVIPNVLPWSLLGLPGAIPHDDS